MQLQESGEMYLETILTLTKRGTPFRSIDVCEEMGYSKPSVSRAMGLLRKGELITDAQINASPYNSYTTKGLPPGPIANPGLASLDAALDPNDTSYYFFIFDQSAGVHRFSKTLAEHEKKIKQIYGD